jgi:hypothetical protein
MCAKCECDGRIPAVVALTISLDEYFAAVMR